MFQRKVTVEYGSSERAAVPCPIKWLDSFAMRNFTNDAVFDDTLPVDDGVLEIGNRVPKSFASRWREAKLFVGLGEMGLGFQGFVVEDEAVLYVAFDYAGVSLFEAVVADEFNV